MWWWRRSAAPTGQRARWPRPQSPRGSRWWANKALLAVHGAELAGAAEGERALAFEAAVAGGIPVIKALREGLAGNRISRVAGILNGTCNYILTDARARAGIRRVLAEAQKLGYAEADPSSDIDGIDAAHKLAILAALAFGRPVAFDTVHVEGIRHVSALDIAFASELGYASNCWASPGSRRGMEGRVQSCMVPQSAPLARVDGVFNAVVTEGDFVGRVMLEGRGAGAGPTASAVVADLIDIARNRLTPVWAPRSMPCPTRHRCRCGAHLGPVVFLRLMVVEPAGVMADVHGGAARPGACR